MTTQTSTTTSTTTPPPTMDLSDGIYVPPAKRRRLQQQQQREQQQVMDSSSSTQQQQQSITTTATTTTSPQIQRQQWEEQKRVIHGMINRLNVETIKPLLGDLFARVNLIRMRLVLAKHFIQASSQSAAKYAPVYASAIAVMNSKLPEVGECVVKRAMQQFRTAYRRKNKSMVLATTLLLGHLFHQHVIHELVMLQILTLLLDGYDDPTDDAIEVAIQLLQTIGYSLLQVSPAGVRAVTERLRALLHEGSSSRRSKRILYQIEQLLEYRKHGFRTCPTSYPPIIPELDLVEEDDQITFEFGLDDDDEDVGDAHSNNANMPMEVFRVDPNFDENEKEWAQIRAEILGEGSDDDDETDSDVQEGEDGEESDDEEPNDAAPVMERALVPATSTAAGSQALVVQDLSEADLVHLRRQIYLTIMSAAGFEETTHKLAKMDIPIGREEELINMLIECCSQERTFQRHYGMIAGRFCILHERWKKAFMEAFVQQYSTIHRLETNKLRNVAKLFAHLLHTDAMPWSVLATIHLNEDETTSSSRIFLKILMQEMAEALGMSRLKERLETSDPEQSEWFKELFPTDNVRKTRYAINFFTSIGLGPLTDGLREFLKNAPKLILQQAEQNALATKDKDDDSISSSSVSSNSSSSVSTSSSSTGTSSSVSSSSYSSSSRGRRKRRSRRYSSESSRSTGSSYSSGSRREKGRKSSGRRRSRSLSTSSRSDSASESSTRTSRSSSDSSTGKRRSRSRRDRGRGSSRSPSPPRPTDRGGRETKRSKRTRPSKRSRSRSPSIPKEVVKAPKVVIEQHGDGEVPKDYKERTTKDSRESTRKNRHSPSRESASRLSRSSSRSRSSRSRSRSSREHRRSKGRGRRREDSASRSPSPSPPPHHSKRSAPRKDGSGDRRARSRSPSISKRSDHGTDVKQKHGRDDRKSSESQGKALSKEASRRSRSPSSSSRTSGSSSQSRSRGRRPSRSSKRSSSRVPTTRRESEGRDTTNMVQSDGEETEQRHDE